MIKTILVPLDGTALAEKALPYAIRVAKQTHATLLLKRVIPNYKFLGNSEEEQLELAAMSKIYLATVQDKISAVKGHLHLAPHRIKTAVAYGKPVEILTQTVDTDGVDLIVMTTHGRTGLSELALGSTATGLVHNVTVPVMLIQPTAARVEPNLTQMLENPAPLSLESENGNRIVVALDGYHEAEKMLEKAAELARLYRADLHLLEVVVPVPPLAYGVGYVSYVNGELLSVDEEREKAYQYLTKVQAQLAQDGLRCIKVVATGNPATEIANYAAEIEAMCITVVTHAPGRAGLILGSTAYEVLHRSDLPVLMVQQTNIIPIEIHTEVNESAVSK